MSPFKEPQPRKNSVEKDGEKIVGGNWPPYERQGGEANWKEPAKLEVPNTPEAEEFQEAINEQLRQSAFTPLMALPDYSPFQARKAALEAACALQGNQSNATFWGNVGALEAYLRDGTKP